MKRLNNQHLFKYISGHKGNGGLSMGREASFFDLNQGSGSMA